MLGKKEVGSSSQQWETVNYRIQMITGKSSVRILNLYRYPTSQPQSFKTEAVIQTTDLDRDYIDRVTKNTIPIQQMIFYCGHVNIHSLLKEGKVFSFLLCRLNLGRIGTVREEVSMADSVLVESDNERDAFQYNFMINNPQRYQVEYEVYFTINNDREFIESQFECMNCQNRRAKVHCSNQQLNLCEECSKDHHNRRMMNNHQVQRLDKVNTLPNCKKHALKLQNYCLICCKYLCNICLQKGNSHGSNQHPVTPILQLYSLKKEQTEVVSARQKEKLGNFLRSLESKKEEINENYQQTKHMIETTLERSLKTLTQMYQQKMFLITSQEIQLRMLSQKLEWSKTFVRFQQKNLKPIFYFQSQQRFQQEFSKMKLSQLSTILSLKADLAVEGSLMVGKRDQLATPLRHIQQPEQQGSRTLSKWKTLYDYDANVDVALRGQLAAAFENAQLQFFCRTQFVIK